MRIRSRRRLSLSGYHLGASAERQNEQRGEPSTQVHYPSSPRADRPRAYPAPASGSIRLGSVFLTLPTRALTGQQIISSDGSSKSSPPRDKARAGLSGGTIANMRRKAVPVDRRLNAPPARMGSARRRRN